MTLLICRQRYAVLAGHDENDAANKGSFQAGVFIPPVKPFSYVRRLDGNRFEEYEVSSISFLCERVLYSVTMAAISNVLTHHKDDVEGVTDVIHSLALLGVEFIFGLVAWSGYLSVCKHPEGRSSYFSSGPFQTTKYTNEQGCVLGKTYPVVKDLFQLAQNNTIDTMDLLQKAQFLGARHCPAHWAAISPTVDATLFGEPNGNA
jgi:hypothetical protein